MSGSPLVLLDAVHVRDDDWCTSKPRDQYSSDERATSLIKLLALTSYHLISISLHPHMTHILHHTHSSLHELQAPIRLQDFNPHHPHLHEFQTFSSQHTTKASQVQNATMKDPLHSNQIRASLKSMAKIQLIKKMT